MAMLFGKLAGVAMAGMALCAGCTQLPDWSLFDPLRADTPAVQTAYSFSWRLSGSREAGPLQVFDDGRSTWLQFGPAQTVPAIFSRTEHGDRLLTTRRHGQYVVLDGVWAVLVLRAGGLESRVERQEPTAALVSPTDHSEQVSKALPAAEQNVELAAGQPATLPVHNLAPVQVTASSANPAFPLTYRVSPQDGNIRLVLSRWAVSSGWTFEPEHWAVDVDIPIAGSAAFELDFDQAVQQLLASTELSDRPLQPCFYANKVLRVVPYAQSCDRSMPRERV